MANKAPLRVSRVQRVQHSTVMVSAAQSKRSAEFKKTLIHVAWLAVLLGFAMETLTKLPILTEISDLKPILAELAGKITWATFVCIGVAVGKSAAKGNKLWNAGLAGLVSAPLAFALASAIHKGVAELLATTGPNANPYAVVIAVTRGMEYLCLGLALQWMTKQRWEHVYTYMLAGLAIGLVFGSLIILFTPAAFVSTPSVISWAVNELLFPMGCAFILYTADMLGRKLTT